MCRRYFAGVLIACIIILSATCSVLAEEPKVVLLEDFSDEQIGEIPVNLRVKGRREFLKVVEDENGVGSKVLMLKGDPQIKETSVDFNLPVLSEDPVIIAEFSLRVENSDGTNFYLMDSEGVVLLIMSPKNGKLRYNLKDDIATLDSSWNRIKLVVDLEKSEIYVYLNDMDVPIVGPAPFYKNRQCTTREGLFFRYQLSAGPGREDLKGEIYVDDIKVISSADKIIPDKTKTVTTSPKVWAGELLKREMPLPTVIEEPTVKYVKVPLSVSETIGTSRQGQPVSSGVPIPQGQISDTKHVRLLDGNGDVIPLQAGVLSRWEDDSIRWLLLDFQVDVDAKKKVEVVLEYGSEVEPWTGNGITLNEDDETFTVDTGRITIIFSKTGEIIKKVSVGGEVWKDAKDLEFYIEDINGVAFSIADTHRDITVEEEGPLRTVIRVQGEVNASQDLRGAFAYDIRFHFYGNKSNIRIEPTITNLLPHTSEMVYNAEIRQVSLIFPGWMGRGNEDIVYVTSIGKQDSNNVWGSITSILEKAGKHFKGQAKDFSMVQTGNLCEITADGEVTKMGRRGAGWTALEKGDRSIGAGIRYFWEEFPKGIEVNKDGDLSIHLWPKGDDVLVMGGGEAKRHEMYLTLGNSEPQELDGLIHPLLAVAPGEWYSETEGFTDKLFPYSPDKLGLYEHVVEKGYNVMMDLRKSDRAYGWRDFGDYIRTDYTPSAWGNNRYDIAHTYFLQFARSGDLRYFDFAQTVARHYIDIDMIWSHSEVRYIGGALSAAPEHRRNPAIGIAFAELSGLVDYYLLTGDRRSLEAACLMGDWFAKMAIGRPTSGFRLDVKDQSPRTPGNALIQLMYVYETTRDPYYLEGAKEVVGILNEKQTEDGQWIYPVPEIEGNPRCSKPFMTGLVLKGLTDYYRVTEDQLAAELILKSIRFLVDETWGDAGQGFKYISHPSYESEPNFSANFLLLDGLVYGYKLTGEERFLEIARLSFLSGLERLEPHISVKAPIIGREIAMALRFTPLVMSDFIDLEDLSWMPMAKERNFVIPLLVMGITIIGIGVGVFRKG